MSSEDTEKIRKINAMIVKISNADMEAYAIERLVNMLNAKNDILSVENSGYRASLKAISKMTKNAYIKALCEE